MKDDVLPEAESLFDQNKISIQLRKNRKFITQCIDSKFTYKQEVKLSKNKIGESNCNCNQTSTCKHIIAALFLIRRELTKSTTKKGKILSNQNFVSQVSHDDLQNFTISRMKADKDFKTLIQARFLVEVRGVEHFESYLDRAFPPTKTTNITPAHKEVKLFYQVVEELHDQIKDLIGRDDFVAASTILTPLIRKSFYFKNRFVEVPDTFTKTHLHLVEILSTIHEIIEAPSLKLGNAKNVISLLKLSYVQLLDFNEKKLILNLIKTKSNHSLVIQAMKEQVSLNQTKAYKQFLSALSFICSKRNRKNVGDIGNIFVELFSWQQKGYDYLDELFNIGKQYQLPSRFVEKLLTLKPKNISQIELQTQLALSNIEKQKSFSIFKWIYRYHPSIWQESRNLIIEKLKIKKDHHTLIKILIHERNVMDLFNYLKSISDVNIYHQYLTSLLELSEPETFKIYSHWASNYLTNHFGKTALDEFDRHMRKVAVKDVKLRNEIDKYILKNFGERPSINM